MPQRRDVCDVSIIILIDRFILLRSLHCTSLLSPTITTYGYSQPTVLMMAPATPNNSINNNNGNGNGKHKNGKPSTSAAAGDVEVGESTPLLHSGSGTSNSDEPPPLQEMKAESLKERAVAVTAGVSFLSSIAAILFEATAHPVVWVSGVLGAVLAPYAAMQQQKLTQVEALNQTNERMEQEVEQLAAENVRLTRQVQEMEESVIKYVLYYDCG
jgi:hypothetical protein